MSISSTHLTGLHSRYDPWREAEKYIQHAQVSLSKKIYILLEPGYGYLAKVLLNKNPHAKILEVHCIGGVETFSVSAAQPEIAAWLPGSEISLSAFLSTHIDDLEIGSVEIIEWPPAERGFPNAYAKLKHQVRSFLQERRATVHTTGKCGRLWLRNTLKRVAFLPPLITELKVNVPIVIAASGPSLQKALPLLAHRQDSLFILALPSSIRTLTQHKIKPHMVVHSDPGFYSNYHLRSSLSADLQAAPLYAAGYRTALQQLLLLSTGSPIEEFFISKLSNNALRIMPHGTVAGIAYQLATKISTGPIIWAGLDLCYQDIQAHPRPHSFDHLIQTACHRYAPLQDIFFRRSPLSTAGETRPAPLQSFALTRYADWFQRLSPALHNQFFRLFPSAVEIQAFTHISTTEVEAFCDKPVSVAMTKQSIELEEDAGLRALTAFIEEVLTQTDHFNEPYNTSEDVLFRLKNYPLLYELMKYTSLPLLFRLHRGSAKLKDVQIALSKTSAEIQSIIQAVNS
ncbi:MAG: 6-hydroxymethylpterin diphosphokinase MptE-like protein [Spirochaetia bacterium]|nr:6-hydroxymethylpterin diphosphokinase MptE-like protein [Spirochaetia bacterium]